MVARRLVVLALSAGAFALEGCGSEPPSLALDLAAPGDLTMAQSPSDGPRDLTVPQDRAAGCSDDKDCAGATPRCDPKSGQCVGCTQDAQCPEGALCRMGACAQGCSIGHGCGDAGVCDVDAGVCRSCGSDGDCKDPAAPRCDAASMQCVLCLPQKDNCAAGKYCVAKNGAFSCVDGCKGDDECKAGDGGAPAGRCCDRLCVDTAGSNAHCGQCGSACNNGQSCCASACADFTSDVASCGGCGLACKLANATPACKGGQCAVAACANGFGDCDQSAQNGCEIALGADAKNCLACGKACAVAHGTAGCAMGCTVAACDPGFADCNKVVADGCEIEPAKDLAHCGGCAQPCATPHATPACKAGACAVALCDADWGDCNGKPGDGCEVDVRSDPSHCGKCGAMCGNNQVCALALCKPPGTVLFTVDGGSVGAPAIGPDGTIYSVGIDGLLRAIHPVTGKPIWTSAVSSGAGRTYFYAIGGVTLGKTHLYVGGVDTNLYAYDYTGKLAWKAPIGQDGSYATPAMEADGTIIAAGRGAFVVAVNPDGTVKWKYTMGGSVESSSPAIASDGTIYLPTWSDGNMYAINPDGTLKWKKSNGGGAVSSPAIDQNGNIYTGNHSPADTIFHVFKPDGSELWKSPVGNIHGGCALAFDGTVYVGNDSAVIAIKQDTTIRWTSEAVGGWVGGGILLTEDGMVHAPVTGNQTLVIIEPSAGKILATVALGGDPSPPTIGFHGALYIGTSKGKLIAYTGTSRGLDSDSAWPKHHRDYGNSGRKP
ncbi:MAG: hypothetical protein EXR72_13220 [Myxococcales bacterium]|nr:hypothetical protein [Myxococcales bacterium]